MIERPGYDMLWCGMRERERKGVGGGRDEEGCLVQVQKLLLYNTYTYHERAVRLWYLCSFVPQTALVLNFIVLRQGGRQLASFESTISMTSRLKTFSLC